MATDSKTEIDIHICWFCGRELEGFIDAAKHGFFDHSPEGRWIKRRYLDTDNDQ